MTLRTWKYVAAEGEDLQSYVSSDGYEVQKVEEDYPTRDFFWQVIRPSDTYLTINHKEAYCTARAAKQSLAHITVASVTVPLKENIQR